MVNQEVVKKIEELFIAWYKRIMFDSTGTWGKKERDEFVSYCKEHLEEFKDFAQDTLEHPQECCYHVAHFCDELLPEVKFEEVDENLTFIERLERASKMISRRESMTWAGSNRWLNYFKGTKDVDYYKDYADYKEYLSRHYIGWNPFNEDDPNPSYKEFVEHRKNYKI